MKHWFNDDGDPPDPPDWAAFWNGEDYRHFLSLVRAELSRRGLRFEINDGVARVHPDDGGNQLGLQNIAQKCNASAKGSWPDVIAGHFASALGGTRELEDLEERLSDFEAVKELIKARLYPRSMMKTVPRDHLVLWDVADDLVAMLALDLPNTVASVTPETRAKWELSDADLYRLALENVAKQDVPDVEELDLGEGAKGRALIGDSFFVASHALHVSRFVDPTEHGLLLGVPHRHALLIHRIVGIEVLVAINGMLMRLRHMHLEGPGSISDQLYWWREGELTRLPSTVEGDTLKFQPPQSFVDDVLIPLTR
ncbi:MAG: hypothetical protein AAGE52_02830 [Myxococcota bacterium]